MVIRNPLALCCICRIGGGECRPKFAVTNKKGDVSGRCPRGRGGRGACAGAYVRQGPNARYAWAILAQVRRFRDHPAPLVFKWNGEDYSHKLLSDLHFLSKCPLSQYLPFRVTNNPFLDLNLTSGLRSTSCPPRVETPALDTSGDAALAKATPRAKVLPSLDSSQPALGTSGRVKWVEGLVGVLARG